MPFRLLTLLLVAFLAAPSSGQVSPSKPSKDRQDSLTFQIEVLERQISQLQHLRDDQRSGLMEGPELLRRRALSLLRKAHLQGQASDPRIETLHRLLDAVSTAEPETAAARTTAPESTNATWAAETQLEAPKLDTVGPVNQKVGFANKTIGSANKTIGFAHKTIGFANKTIGSAKQTAELFQGSEHCEDAPVLTAGTWLGQTGQTTDGTSRCDLTTLSPDVWYQVVDGDLIVDGFGSQTDLVLSKHGTCPTPEESLAGSCSSGPVAQVSFGQYYLRVSSLLGESGSYLLRASDSRGRIEGRVTHEITGAPLEGVSIVGFSTSEFEARATTDETGSYALENLKSDSYRIYTQNTPDLLDETYPQRVEAFIGSTTSDVDFTLGPGSTVSGEIRDRKTTEPIADALVVLETESRSTVASTLTDASGRFRMTGLAASSYRLTVSTDGAYLEHLYPNIDCPHDCSSENGGLLQVPPGELTDVDLTLTRPATIQGTVNALADGSPLADAMIIAYEPLLGGFSSFLTSTTTQDDGSYSLAVPAEPVQVAAYRPNHLDGAYLPQAYPGFPCPFFSCPREQAQDLAVAVGESIEGIDFSLPPAGRIEGTLDLPGFDGNIALVEISVYDELSVRRGSSVQYYAPFYPELLIDLLPEGSYRLKSEVYDTSQWVDLIYPDIPCLPDDCDVSQGDLIPVSLGQTTPDIDFVLPSPDKVTGRVVDDATSAPLAYATVTAWKGLNAEQPFTTIVTDTDGTFEILGLEPSQRFYLTAEIKSHRRGLYNGGTCEGSPGSSGCSAPPSSALHIGIDGAITGIDLRLVERPVGHIEGFRSLRSSGGGFVGAAVQVVNAETGVETMIDESDDFSGRYRVSNLDPGTYYARTSPYDRWDAQAYDDQPCFTGTDGETQCPLGTPITVRAGETTADIDFELDQFGWLSVTLIDETTGENIAGYDSRLHLWSENGALVETATVFQGRFQFNHLRPENYYLTTELNNGYIDTVVGGALCFPGTNCDLSSGTVIQGRYAEGDVLTFSARRGADITGTVTSPEGDSLDSDMQVWDATGRPVMNASSRNGVYSLVGLPQGDYYVAAEAYLRHQELYPNIRCSEQGCDPFRGQLITVTEGRLVTGIDFELDSKQTCDPATDLCLGNGRFRVTAQRLGTDPGPASPELLTLDSGYFWFFDSDNVEVVVKVLDACGINDRFWIFAAGLTDLEVELTVTDLATGLDKVFTSTEGQAFPPILDTEGLTGCDQVFPATSPTTKTVPTTPPSLGKLADCTADNNSLCLTQDRFRVTSQWQSQDASGLGGAQAITADTGYFWFFDPDNLELVIKVLDACAINDKFWVFTSGLTEVGVELQVEDTTTGTTWDLETNLGDPFQPVFDTQAFDCP